MYAAKGERGEQGVQGVTGPPGTTCVCSYMRHECTKLVRYITGGGSRTLASTDTLVIVNTTKSCKFLLPKVIVPRIEESKDHYYYPIIIEIMVEAGIHDVTVEEGCTVNEYFANMVLDKKKLYTFLSTPQGQWLFY